MKTLTRALLVDSLVQKGDLSPHQASLFLKELLEIMCSALASHRDIKISGFGSFIIRAKKRRMGRNPKTMQEAPISSRYVLSFKPSASLKEKVEKQENKKDEEVPEKVSCGSLIIP